jgi:spore coat polysaccharide biosynthesis protein SpsF
MSEKNIVICLQVRTDSSRVFQKPLLKINSKTVLELCINRLKKIDKKIKIYILTTSSPKEVKVINLCIANNISFFRGSNNDVLKRYNNFLNKYNYKNCIRATCDNLFVNIKSAKLLIKKHLKNKYDYSTNHYNNLPIGCGVDIFSKKVINSLSSKKLSKSEKEHINLHIIKNPSKFKTDFKKLKVRNNGLRLTLDTYKDYAVIKKNYSFYNKKF